MNHDQFPRTRLQQLTRREAFAMRAMQGALAGDLEASMKPMQVAQFAVRCADALIAELAKDSDDENRH